MPHYNYARYIVEHGTSQEKRDCRETLQTMQLFLDTFPGGHWEPMEGIKLIDHLVELSEKLAEKRWQTAHIQQYNDYQGKIGRTFDEERITVRAHLATQIMLGLPLGKPDSKEEARRVGNIGGNNEAFVPIHNPFQHHLIVDPRTQDHITSWLVIPEGGREFRLKGWIKAENAKRPEHLRRRGREGGDSVSYWVHPDLLHSVKEWWAVKEQA